MPITEKIESALLPHNLIPLWRGGKLVPEMLRAYEQRPATLDTTAPATMVCNYGVQPDGGIVDGEIISNTVYNRDELGTVIISEPEEIEIPDANVEIEDTPVGQFEYYSEKTIDDNFEF
jgi:hypothetical protein